MDSSRTRNSILDWLLAASIALAVLVAIAGVDVRIGGMSVRSHSALRVLVATAVLAVIRWQAGIQGIARWLMRVALLTAICGSVLSWFRFPVTK